MTHIELREALPFDSAFVFDVRRKAFREYVELAEGWNEDRELERHRDRFSRLRFRVIVADGSDAGYIVTAVYPKADEYRPASLYLHQLMILPSFQSMGIGAICLKLLSDEAREIRMPLRLSVLRCNPRALAFYIRAGCRVVDETDLHISLEARLINEGRSDSALKAACVECLQNPERTSDEDDSRWIFAGRWLDLSSPDRLRCDERSPGSVLFKYQRPLACGRSHVRPMDF